MRKMDLGKNVRVLLKDLSVGRIRGVAYDTAWVSRLMSDGRPRFPGALRWLLRNQMWDGSWGSEIDYKHDRVLSTLSAVISLELNDGEMYKERIERGLDYLWNNINKLDQDPFETIGSELLIPTLIEEADDLGLDPPRPPPNILFKQRRKLSLIPDDLIYSEGTTLTHSMEFLGNEVEPEKLKDVMNANGSLGCSPSATAFLLTRVKDTKALRYLEWTSEKMASRGFPSQIPFDVFEYSWVLYNLMKAGWRNDPSIRTAALRLCEFWKKDGVAWGSEFPCIDSDTTALTFKVLRECGQRPDPGVFDPFELEEGFKCFHFELNPSTSINVHILEALREMPRSELPRKDEIIEKIIRFLEKSIINGERWDDKWHVSPYYTTGHGVLALSDVAPYIVEGPIDWILRTQNPDGGWGAFDISTSEETSYALQALIEYSSSVEPLEERAMLKGAIFLQSRINDVFERLWISKGLYCPVNVVMSSVLSALRMFKEYHQMDILQEKTMEIARTGTIGVEHEGGT